MSTQIPDSVAAANAAGLAAEAQARARDAADNAAADAAMAGADQPLPDTPLTDAPQPAARPAPKRIGGDDQGTLHTDDFGLDGDLTSVMTQALEKAFESDLASDSPADTAATPDPALPSDAAPIAAPGDGAGVGGAAEPGAAPLPAAPGPGPGTPPTADDFSLDAYARDYFGTNLDRQSAQNLFGVLGGIQSATPEQRQQIDQILTGRQVGVSPPSSTPAAPDGYQQPGAAEVPIPGLPPRPTDEYEAQVYDRLIAPLARAQAEQVQALRADIERTTQTQLQQQQQQMAARIDSAEAEWRTQHPILTDGEFDALRQRIVTSGTFNGLVNAHHGDVAAATNAAYEQHFWSNPALRERALANAASGRDPLTALPDPANPTATDQASLEAGRRQLAASVAGGGGHAPIRTAPAPKNKAERQAAMTAEIAAHMENQ